jgi:hypothetical protein
MSSTVERRGFLEARLADPAETENRFVGRFLRPPLSFGTLYTAACYPGTLAVEYRRPHQSALRQTFADFPEDERSVYLGLPAVRERDVSGD